MDLDKIIHRSIIKEAYTAHRHSGHNDDYYNKVEYYNDPKCRSGREWAKNGGNFAVKRNGKIYYVSRSVSMSLYAFCKNKNGEWCVLANQRGPGAPNANGLWNVPCGYLDYNETTENGVCRETWEETGVKIPADKIRMMGVNSNPVGNVQNVGIRYAAVLDGVVDNYPTSDANCEPGEVSNIAWIPLSKVNSIKWAFGQGSKIIPQAKTSLGDYENGDITLDKMIAELKIEVSNNPKAKFLLDNILKELYKQ